MNRKRVSRREFEDRRILERRLIEDRNNKISKKVGDDYFLKDIFQREEKVLSKDGKSFPNINEESKEKEERDYIKSKEYLKNLLQREESQRIESIGNEAKVEVYEKLDALQKEKTPGRSFDIQIQHDLENDPEITYLRARLAANEINEEREIQIQKKASNNQEMELELKQIEDAIIEGVLSGNGKEIEKEKENLIRNMKYELDNQMEEKALEKEKNKRAVQFEAQEMRRFSENLNKQLELDKQKKMIERKEIKVQMLSQMEQLKEARKIMEEMEKEELKKNFDFTLSKDEEDQRKIQQYKERQEKRNQLIDKIAEEIIKKKKEEEEAFEREVKVSLANEMQRQKEKEAQELQGRRDMLKNISKTNEDLIDTKKEILQKEDERNRQIEIIQREFYETQEKREKENYEAQRKAAFQNKKGLEEQIRFKFDLKNASKEDRDKYMVDLEKKRQTEIERLVKE